MLDYCLLLCTEAPFGLDLPQAHSEGELLKYLLHVSYLLYATPYRSLGATGKVTFNIKRSENSTCPTPIHSKHTFYTDIWQLYPYLGLSVFALINRSLFSTCSPITRRVSLYQSRINTCNPPFTQFLINENKEQPGKDVQRIMLFLFHLRNWLELRHLRISEALIIINNPSGFFRNI